MIKYVWFCNKDELRRKSIDAKASRDPRRWKIATKPCTSHLHPHFFTEFVRIDATRRSGLEKTRRHKPFWRSFGRFSIEISVQKPPVGWRAAAAAPTVTRKITSHIVINAARRRRWAFTVHSCAETHREDSAEGLDLSGVLWFRPRSAKPFWVSFEHEALQPSCPLS